MKFNSIAFIVTLLSSGIWAQPCTELSTPDILNCGTPSDVLQVTSFEVHPSKLIPGTAASFRLQGNLIKPIVKGATVSFIVKLNGEAILNIKNSDLCQHLSTSETKLSCPIQTKKLDISNTIMLPSYASKGEYEFIGLAKQGYEQIYHLKSYFKV